MFGGLTDNNLMDGQIIGDQLVHKGKYYSYVVRKILEKTGSSYDYECIVQNGNGGKGGVEICPLVRCKNKSFLVIVENYRYAVKSWVLEFPGGMIDGQETPEQTAMRELKEETGFVGSKVLHVAPPMLVDPWKSNDVNLSAESIRHC